MTCLPSIFQFILVGSILEENQTKIMLGLFVATVAGGILYLIFSFNQVC